MGFFCFVFCCVCCCCCCCCYNFSFFYVVVVGVGGGGGGGGGGSGGGAFVFGFFVCWLVGFCWFLCFGVLLLTLFVLFCFGLPSSFSSFFLSVSPLR